MIRVTNQTSPMECELVDLAAELLPVIESHLGRPFEEQLAAWQEFYAGHAPTLPERLYSDYSDIEGGWKSIARERVWPHFAERIENMKAANDVIRGVYQDIYHQAREVLDFAGPMFVVTYVGIGNGAGWATQWENRFAILCGLENIAELGWYHEYKIRGLLSHEIGHLFMMSVRGCKDTQRLTADPLLVLYEEGFAQHCEHVMMGSETWHCSSQNGWVEWCMKREGYLARRYLEAMQEKEKRRRFFGSWLEIDGWRQTGYFLGCRIVQRMAESMSLREIAIVNDDEIKISVEEYLRSFG